MSYNALALSTGCTVMCKTKKVERRDFLSCEHGLSPSPSTKLYYPSFLLRDTKTKFGEPLLKFHQELFGVSLSLTGHRKSSGAGESHPHPLTDPDVNISAHPALIAQPLDALPIASGRTMLDLFSQFFLTNILPSDDVPSTSCISSSPIFLMHDLVA